MSDIRKDSEKDEEKYENWRMTAAIAHTLEMIAKADAEAGVGRGDCLSSEQLEMYMTGELSPEERENAGRHLRNCAYCMAEIANARAVIESVDLEFEELTPEVSEGVPAASFVFSRVWGPVASGLLAIWEAPSRAFERLAGLIAKPLSGRLPMPEPAAQELGDERPAPQIANLPEQQFLEVDRVIPTQGGTVNVLDEGSGNSDADAVVEYFTYEGGACRVVLLMRDSTAHVLEDSPSIEDAPVTLEVPPGTAGVLVGLSRDWYGLETAIRYIAEGRREPKLEEPVFFVLYGEAMHE